jgi:hypothetical protein
VATTQVTAKYDVKYGQEALVVPSNLQVPVDLMGRLDMDVPPGHTTTSSISYPGSQTDPSGTGYSTVVFLLISATAQTVPFAGLRFSVDPAAATSSPAATTSGPAAPGAARASSRPPAPPPAESAEEYGEEGEASGRQTQAPVRQAQQSPPKPASPPAASPAPPSPPATQKPKWFYLEYPMVLLGNGQVSTLDANPTTFTFQNNSRDPVQVSVRVGRQLNQQS